MSTHLFVIAAVFRGIGGVLGAMLTSVLPNYIHYRLEGRQLRAAYRAKWHAVQGV